MSATLAVVERKEGASSIYGMDSESLGIFVRDGVVGVAQKLVELKPYIEELWRRIDQGEVILGCSTKKEFCQQVLQRTPRAVRYMLEGGNHNRGETVSPSRSYKDAPQITDAEFADYVRKHPHVPQSAANMLAQDMPPTDVIGALIGMDIPKPMAVAAVRILAAPHSAPQDHPIRFELCSRTDPRYEKLREDHYIENHGCIGQQAHFLIHYKGELAGIISGASPAYATSPRDEFFGLNRDNRDKCLQGIVSNVVFRLPIHERNLATQVLRLWRNLIPHLWYEKYGVIVYGFETFVVETDTRKGALYLADNWTLAGITTGATKIRNGIEKPADNWKTVTPKLVYCRWRDGFSHVCSARTPVWVKLCCADMPAIKTAKDRRQKKSMTVEEQSA